MRVRTLDLNNDWSYGRGANDYKQAVPAIAQSIQTRLSSFLGDCFFDLNAGIDWFNLLGGKDRLALTLAISTVILNTKDVTGVRQLSVDVNENRLITVKYVVQTTYSTAAGLFQFDVNGIQ